MDSACAVRMARQPAQNSNPEAADFEQQMLCAAGAFRQMVAVLLEWQQVVPLPGPDIRCTRYVQVD